MATRSLSRALKRRVRYTCPKCAGEATGHLVLPGAVIHFFHDKGLVCHVRAKAVRRRGNQYFFSRLGVRSRTTRRRSAS
jgi:hypothetical protein